MNRGTLIMSRGAIENTMTTMRRDDTRGSTTRVSYPFRRSVGGGLTPMARKLPATLDRRVALAAWRCCSLCAGQPSSRFFQ